MRAKRIFYLLLREAGIGLALILLALVFAAAAPRFASVTNVTNILTQISINTVIAVGMTFVILLGGIDLSVGSVLALATIVGGLIITSETLSTGMAILLSVAGSTLVGCLCGLFNGVVCERWKIHSFIVTLGMLNIARGAALQISNSRTIFSFPDSFNEVGAATISGVPIIFLMALQMVQDRPSIFRRMILVGTGPRGGEDIMHLEKPSLAKRIQDPANRGYDVLKKIFLTSSTASQAAGEAFIRRISQRKDDLDPPSGPTVASAQIAAFREWEGFKGERFVELRSIRHPTLVVNGVHDEMIPVPNSYRLSENLPNAVLLTYPDAGHGSLFQYPESFTRHAAAFLSSDSESAAF